MEGGDVGCRGHGEHGVGRVPSGYVDPGEAERVSIRGYVVWGFSAAFSCPFVEPCGWDEASILLPCVFEAWFFIGCFDACVDEAVVLVVSPGGPETPGGEARCDLVVVRYDWQFVCWGCVVRPVEGDGVLGVEALLDVVAG